MTRYKRHILKRKQTASIFFLALFLIATKNIFYNRADKQAEERGLPQTAVVTYVIDGDTITIGKGYKVRYIGIDTPETSHPQKAVEYFGKEAFAFNKGLVLGKRIRLEYDVQKFDKYARLLAYVHVDGIFVNAKIVQEGYGQVYTVPPNVRYADLFLSLQRKARAAKKGLWH